MRAVAGILLLTMLAVSIGALVAFGARAERFPTPPFPLAQLTADSRIRVAAPPGVARRLVVLYASEHCPHCHAELARWMRVVNSTPTVRGGVMLVVLTPQSASASESFERTLRLVPHARLVDSVGALARQLRVRSVPTTFFVDASDTVRAITVGQTSDLIIRRHLADLMGGSGGQLD